MMVDEIGSNHHQNNNGHHRNQKIRVPTAQRNGARPGRRHLLRLLFAFFDASFPLLKTLLSWVFRTGSLTRSSAQVFHTTAHSTIVAVGLLLLRIRCGDLFWLGGFRALDGSTANSRLATFCALLALRWRHVALFFRIL